MALCAKVARTDAEKARLKLIEAGLFDIGFIPLKEGELVFFPVTGKLKPADAKKLGISFVEKELRTREKRFQTLDDALRGKLTEKELGELIRSFDVIGDIAMLEIPENLEKKEKLIADAIMEVHRNVKVVAKKTGPMSGQFRVRKLKVLAGENRTETVYKEHGSPMKVDVAKVYFSPRLSFERKRIAGLVKKNEKVLVLFAGVGPFAFAIARRQPKTEIVAVELNPDAVRLMEENIKMNHFENVTAVLADVHDIPKDYANWADRILMPLPKDAHEFLEDAIKCARKNCIVHFYHFGEIGKAFIEAKKLVRGAARKQKRKVEFVEERVVRPYSPATEQIVIDFKVL